MEIEFEGEKLLLLGEAAVFWPRKSALLLSDLHLGKISHFRKAGIGIPAEAQKETLLKLESLFKQHRPGDVFFLGDLFHSSYNQEWEIFDAFTRKYSRIDYHLVKGNHDILPQEVWDKSQINISEDYIDCGPFVLAHDAETLNADKPSISGHIHPCVHIGGVGKQTLRFPCFWHNSKGIVLPSFGSFTGMHRVKLKKGDRVYLIADKQIVLKEIHE